MTASAGLQIVHRYLEHLSTRHGDDSIYRGHGDEGWSLVPAAFRGPIVEGIRATEHLHRWKRVAARFADRAETDLGWLVLAQHYGVPTVLLDWTTNPLVALYFACQPVFDPAALSPRHGMVHMLPGKSLPTAPTNRGWNPLEPYSGPPLLIDALAMNKRTLAQDSVMTLHQEATSQPTPGYQSAVYRIEVQQKQAVLAALRVMGVSSDRIFADIGVVAREFIDELRQAELRRLFPPHPLQIPGSSGNP